MPGTVRSLIVGGGLAVASPATVGTIPVFSGATPPDEVIDSTLVQTSSTLITQGGAFRFGNVAEARRWTMDMADAAQGGLILTPTGRSAFSASAGFNGGVFIGSTSLGTMPSSIFPNVAIGSLGDMGTGAGRNFQIIGDGCGSTAGTKLTMMGRNLIANSGNGILLFGQDITVSGAVTDVIGIKIESGSSTCTIGHNDAIVIGGASTSADGQCLIGGGSIRTNVLIFGQGVTGSGTILTTDKEFHPTDGSGSNVATNPFRIRGMRPTGNAAGGNLVLEGFTVGASGSTAQTIVPVLTIQQTSGAAGQAGVRFDTVTSGAAAAVGTLNNAPAAGNPTFWLPVDIAGTVRYIPCW